MSAAYERSCCIDWQFAEAGELDARLRAAKAAGLEFAEFHLWCDKPIEALATAQADAGMRLTSLCVDPRRSIVDPAQRDEMITAVQETIAATAGLGKPNLIVASGFWVEKLEEEHFANAVTALRAAADAAEAADVMLLLEPLNTQLFATMYLVNTKLGLDLVEAVDSPNLRLLDDVRHRAVMGEDMAKIRGGRMHLVAHVQVADMPDRNEPGTDSLDWNQMARSLRDLGCSGAIGLEYFATMPMEESLALSQRMLAD